MLNVFVRGSKVNPEIYIECFKMQLDERIVKRLRESFMSGRYPMWHLRDVAKEMVKRTCCLTHVSIIFHVEVHQHGIHQTWQNKMLEIWI